MSEIETPDVADAGSGPDPDPRHADAVISDSIIAEPASTQPAPYEPVTPSAATPAPELTRRGRIRKWDRPPPPRDWRWYVGAFGKILITLGLLMFGFVAYQLWGTGIETARAQNALENEFEDLLATTPAVEVADPFVEVDEPVIDQPPATTPDPDADPEPGAESEPETLEPGAEPEPEPVTTEPEPGATTEPVVVPVENQNLPLVEDGDAIARIEIPRIGVNDIVVAGVKTSDLKKGPGHFPDTPLPGQLGNAAIAGHRTTYGQPFHDVDKLEPGDEIRMTTLNGVFVYRVTGTQIVTPSDYQVVATTDPTTANLTLTSCHPKWTARQRIVIFSELDQTASAAVGEPVLNYGQDEVETIDDLPAEGEVADTVVADSDDSDESASGPQSDGDVTGNLADDLVEDPEPVLAAAGDGFTDAFSDGWFSDPSANSQVGLWGMVLALIGVCAYLLSRKFRRDWVGAMVGIVPFVVALYFFFQNVNRLLPPNL